MQAKMLNLRAWINCADERFLKYELDKMLKGAGFNIEAYCEKKFEPYGFTALWLLSESHLAIHTFPEENKVYLELSSCVETPYKNFKKLLFSWLKTKKFSYNIQNKTKELEK